MAALFDPGCRSGGMQARNELSLRGRKETDIESLGPSRPTSKRATSIAFQEQIDRDTYDVRTGAIQARCGQSIPIKAVCGKHFGCHPVHLAHISRLLGRNERNGFCNVSLRFRLSKTQNSRTDLIHPRSSTVAESTILRASVSAACCIFGSKA